MTYTEFYILIDEALQADNLEMFVAECGTSVVFIPDPDGVIPDLECILADLQNIWDIAHMSVREMTKAAGISQTKLATRFHIPLRTVQNWCTEVNACPNYVRLMMADLLGLITVERT